MARFDVSMEVDNMAFGDGVDPEARNYEVARVLRELADKIEADYVPMDNYRILRDINGNTVGTAQFKD